MDIRITFYQPILLFHLLVWLFVYLVVCSVSFIIHSQQNVDSKVGRQITFYWPAWLQEHNKPWNEIVWKIDENVYFNIQTETFLRC